MYKNEQQLTLSRVKELLTYDKASGLFTWIKAISRRNKVGAIAGSCRNGKYIIIGIDGNTYYAHRLAWLFVYGVWPQTQVEHRDQNPSNNSIRNLRLSTQSQNMANRKPWKRKHALPRGVTSNRSGTCFSAKITVNKQVIQLGSCSTADEAHELYVQASLKYHREFSIFK